MAACARCNAPTADLFTPSGDMVCRFCFNADQNAQADARANESLEREGQTAGVAVAGTSPPSPGKLIAMGFGLVGVAVVVTVATVVALDRVYPIWVGLIALAGIANIGRGLALRRR